MKHLNFEAPSIRIDAVICDLVAAITHFSDSYCDADCLKLTEDEIELIVVSLIKSLIEGLEGRTLNLLLYQIRHEVFPTNLQEL